MERESHRAVNVPILMYHHLTTGIPQPGRYEISRAQFEQELEVIQRLGYRTLTLGAMLRALREGEDQVRRCVVITFDDGYRSFRELALPALQARSMTATLFVPAGHIGGTNTWDIGRGFAERVIMNETELKDVLAQGVEIGAHGWQHVDLRGCSPQRLEREIAGARTELAQRLGAEIRTFCYPYGHYSSAMFGPLREAGYAGAVSIFSTERSVTGNPFAMRRVYVHEGDTPLRFRLKLSRPYLLWRGWRRN